MPERAGDGGEEEGGTRRPEQGKAHGGGGTGAGGTWEWRRGNLAASTWTWRGKMGKRGSGEGPKRLKWAFSPGSWHEPGLKVALVPVRVFNRHYRWALAR